MKISQILTYFVGCLGIVAVDQLTKHLVIHYLEEPVIVFQGLSLVLVKNRGISWGMLSADNALSFFIVCILVAVVTALLAYHTYTRWRENRLIIGELIVLSGALSNLFDRIWYAGVIDFIELSYCGWHFPAFNVADCAIVIGVACMLYEVFYNG